MTTLFAIVKTNCGREVRRIDTNSKISDAATSEFTKQYSDFFSLCGAEERKKRRFEATWTKANEDEVLFIENFVDEIGISDAIKDPTSVSIFDPAKDMPYLRGMFTTSDACKLSSRSAAAATLNRTIFRSCAKTFSK